jgi:hypothetical protein
VTWCSVAHSRASTGGLPWPRVALNLRVSPNIARPLRGDAATFAATSAGRVEEALPLSAAAARSRLLLYSLAYIRGNSAPPQRQHMTEQR